MKPPTRVYFDRQKPFHYMGVRILSDKTRVINSGDVACCDYWGGGVDESPDCYKRIDRVLAAHSNSLKIIHRLTPIGVAMAGESDYDPFKD